MIFVLDISIKPKCYSSGQKHGAIDPMFLSLVGACCNANMRFKQSFRGRFDKAAVVSSLALPRDLCKVMIKMGGN